MKKTLSILAIGASALMLLSAPNIGMAHLPNSAIQSGKSGLASVLKKVTPTIVNISVEKAIPTPLVNPFEPPPGPRKTTKVMAIGSGVIINAKQGLIVTNAHVVKDQRLILVTLKDGRRYRAKLLGEDDGFDIAIITIKAKHLTQLPFADSDRLQVGDFVAAIGSPFGLTQSVTSGVVSALNRVKPKIEGYQSFIQTDAPINPGNSGGALVNMKGQLVGINTAIYTSSAGNIGIGFSIPSNMVSSVVRQLLKYGKVKRGILGVLAQNVTPELADALNIKGNRPVIVTQVVPGSPAAKAGIKPEDIIRTVNGRIIHTSTQLRNTLGLMRPGTKISIKVLRNHKSVTLHAIVGNPKMVLKQTETPFIGGMRLQKFTELEGDGVSLNGILVTKISDTSNAALAGLNIGDVITAANGKVITTPLQLKKIAESKPKQLLLRVVRDKITLFLVIMAA